MLQFAPLYPWLYRLLRPTFSTCLWSGSSQHCEIALSFDDGPHPIYTPQLLDVLAAHQVVATFFLLGVCVQRYPHVVKDIYDRGRRIGLHGYTHRLFPQLTGAQLKETLQQTRQVIAIACGLDPTTLPEDFFRDVRPPYGVFLPHTLTLLQQWGYRPVMWSVVPEDWLHPGVSIATKRVLKQVCNGALIVLHDGTYGGRDVAETVQQLIPELQGCGYQFVTVDRLWVTVRHPLVVEEAE